MFELSLFSGAGGGLLAAKWLLGWTCVGYVEVDNYCQRVLAQRIRDGYLDNAPIFSDIRTFIDEGYASVYQGMVDIITAGFPCPKFSRAGKGEGFKADDLMFRTIDVVAIIKPRYLLWENVEGFIRWEKTLRDEVENLGYDCRAGIFNALDFGVPQNRPRYFGISVRRGIMSGALHLRRFQGK